MNRKISMKSITLVARSEYIRWLINPKMILLAVVFLPMRDFVVVPLLRASEKMGSPINALEPCISTMNSWMGLLLLSLTYMLLIAPFPTADGNMLFYVARMGRKNWILGEMLFQMMSVFTYSLITTAVTVAQVFHNSFFDNGWSLVVTDFDKLYGDLEEGVKITEILPPNLFFQMSPFKAYLLSFGLFSLFLLLCGMLFLTGCLYQKRLLFFFAQVVHITVGNGLIAIWSSGMWFFPVSHSLLACHYRKYFRKYVFSPWLSLILFGAVLLIIGIVMYRKAQKVSLDMIGGDVLS